VTGIPRDACGYVFGGAMLPTFLDALSEGTLVITLGDRADLVLGVLAARAAGSPSFATHARSSARSACSSGMSKSPGSPT